MYVITFCVTLLLILVQGQDQFDNKMDVYYNPTSHIAFRMTSIENNLMKNNNKRVGLLMRRLNFRANGCTCQDNVCGCCTGINLQQLNFNREGCMNLTYIPSEFAVNVNMILDGNSIFTNTVSGKNPSPLCLPVGVPTIPISLDICGRIFDIYTVEQNLHVCFDLETKFQKATFLVLHFDCMILGNKGPALIKPGSTESTLFSTTDHQIDTDIFDEVSETKKEKQIDLQTPY